MVYATRFLRGLGNAFLYLSTYLSMYLFNYFQFSSVLSISKLSRRRGMPWAQSSAGVEEWVGPDPPAVVLGRGRLVTAPATEAPAPPRKLSLAEQIAATRAKQAAATAELARSKTRPVWPASVDQAAEWPRLADASGRLRHGLALRAVSGEPKPQLRKPSVR